MSTRLVTGVGKWTVIEDFVALSNFTSKIFTISPPIDFTKDSMLVMEMEIISLSGTGNRVAISVNGIDAGLVYFLDGVTIKGGVKTILDINGQSNWVIADLDLFADVDDVVHAIVYFSLNQLNNEIKIQSFAHGVQQTAHQVLSGVLTTSQTEINKISLFPFSVGLKAGSRITIYRIPR